MGWSVVVMLAVAVVLLVVAVVQTLLIWLQARLLGFLARKIGHSITRSCLKAELSPWSLGPELGQ